MTAKWEAATACQICARRRSRCSRHRPFNPCHSMPVTWCAVGLASKAALVAAQWRCPDAHLSTERRFGCGTLRPVILLACASVQALACLVVSQLAGASLYTGLAAGAHASCTAAGHRNHKQRYRGDQLTRLFCSGYGAQATDLMTSRPSPRMQARCHRWFSQLCCSSCWRAALLPGWRSSSTVPRASWPAQQRMNRSTAPPTLGSQRPALPELLLWSGTQTWPPCWQQRRCAFGLPALGGGLTQRRPLPSPWSSWAAGQPLRAPRWGAGPCMGACHD